MRILVVEDEVALREELKTKFTDSGFGVDVAADGKEGLFAGLNYPLDAAIVDIGLPFQSGLEIVQEWRTRELTFPVLMLTGRGGWQNRVAGIRAGADDYIEKPFSFEELFARVECVVRRVHGWASPHVICGHYVLDTASLTASVSGAPLELTTFEFRLLEMLMLNAGKVLSTSTILEHLYEESVDHESNVVQYFISRLRAKIDPTGRLQPIETVYGGGYRFAIARGRPKIQ